MSSYAVVTPSRGLVHSRTVAAVMANVAQSVHESLGWHLTHDLPIPDCDERSAEAGLATGADAVWFIEEDVLPPTGALDASFALLEQGFDVAAVDYPVGAPQDAWGCMVRDGAAEILWCGLGCTLIRREVFDALARPWFTTDWVYTRHGTDWEPQLRDAAREPNDKRYGQQDIRFCMQLRQVGYRIGQVPGMIAGHAYVAAMGTPGSNVGFHDVRIRDVIAHQYPG